MSDSDSDSHSSMGEAEGACGKLLEEIAQQEQVAEVSFHTVQLWEFLFVYLQVDPIDILIDKLFSFVDLDRNIVSDDDRETLYKQLEEIGLNQDTAVILFESQNNTIVKVPLDTDSNLPKTLLIKPASGAVKVMSH